MLQVDERRDRSASIGQDGRHSWDQVALSQQERFPLLYCIVPDVEGRPQPKEMIRPRVPNIRGLESLPMA